MQRKRTAVYGKPRTARQTAAVQILADFSSPASVKIAPQTYDPSALRRSPRRAVPDDDHEVAHSIAKASADPVFSGKDVALRSKSEISRKKALGVTDANTVATSGRRVRKSSFSSSDGRNTPRFADAELNDAFAGLKLAGPSTTDSPRAPRCQPSTAQALRKAPRSPRLAAPRIKRPPIPSPESLYAVPAADDSELLSHAAPLLTLCEPGLASKIPTSFSVWADMVSQAYSIVKVAEASYGEVYRLEQKTRPSMLEKARSQAIIPRPSVLKIMALRPPPERIRTAAQKRKASFMSAVDDVASECRLLARMTAVPGFTVFKEVRVMQGRLPPTFITAWRTFHRTVKESVFPDPALKSSYGEDQLWAVVEMEDAGKDLENVAISSGDMVWDAFWGVAIALSKGEQWAHFEHRDLHLGNICIRPAMRDVSENNSSTLGHAGIETTIIDYTLSRADMDGVLAQDSCSSPAFFDLNKDPAIFEGDASEDNQYEVYRQMRSLIVKDSVGRKTDRERTPRRGNNARKGDWSIFFPGTNVLWLHYVSNKLIELFCANNGELDVSLQAQLDELEEVLDPDSSCMAKSAQEIVAWALEKKWLAREDLL